MAVLEQIQFEKLLKKLEDLGLVGLLRLKTPKPDPPKPTDTQELRRLVWDKDITFTKSTGRNRFFINNLGQRITDESFLTRYRELSRQAFTDSARLSGMSLKDPITQWGETGLAFQLHYIASMEEVIPDLRLCSNHWKAEQLAKETYPGWVRPLLNRKKEATIKQEGDSGLLVGDEDAAEEAEDNVDLSSPITTVTLTSAGKRKLPKNHPPDPLRDPKRIKHQHQKHTSLQESTSSEVTTPLFYQGATAEPTAVAHNNLTANLIVGPNVEPNKPSSLSLSLNTNK